MKYPEPHAKLWQASFELYQKRSLLCELADQTDDLELLEGIGKADDLLKASSDELARIALTIFDRVNVRDNPDPDNWWNEGRHA